MPSSTMALYYQYKTATYDSKPLMWLFFIFSLSIALYTKA